MADPELPDALRDELRAAWHRYLDLVAPCRPALHAVCRRLTGNVWEAEDLVQDTLLRAFATLGSVHHPIANPRAYLLRTATNLWIDAVRRRGTESEAVARLEPGPPPPAPGGVREAGERLLQRLSPQERAAVVLKEAFEMSLEEIADVLCTTAGAVKAALHRGRGRLAEPEGGAASQRPRPSVALVDRFVALYAAADVPGLVALMLGGGSIENVGCGVELGRDNFPREGGWLHRAVFGHPEWPAELQYTGSRLARAELDGEPIVLGFTTRRGREALEQVLRIDEMDGRIARLRGYAFCPETMREVGARLGLRVRTGLYRYPTPAPGRAYTEPGAPERRYRAVFREGAAMPDPTEARKALHELIDLLREVDERFLSPEWLIGSPQDVAEGMRAVMHALQGGLQGWFETDPEHPEFRRIVAPWRKFTGDNADAIYFDASLRGDRRYRVRGRMDGAVYVSLTVEAGSQDGRMGGRTDGVINDTQFDVDAEGRFEVRLGGPPAPRNWIALPPDASRVTTRHYYEDETCAAADPSKHPALSIEVLDEVGPPTPPNDANVAEGLRRVANFVRARTLEMPPPGKRAQPAFVSTTPNQFPAPCSPAGLGLAALDACYSMAPYLLAPGQALVMRGRWPACRCANVDLWNRFQQTYDYANRQVTLNRKQTELEPDGSFRIVIAHEDPGVPNWLDTEGRPFGMVFWRFFLPEGAIETPRAEVVPLAQLRER